MRPSIAWVPALWVLLAATTDATAARTVVAAVQDVPVPGAVAANRERLARRVREAAKAGARYVVLPELALTGPVDAVPARARARAVEPIPGPSVEFFARLARQARVWLAFSLAERVDGGHAVTAVLLDDGGRVVQTRRKVIPRPDGSDGAALVRGDARAPLEGVEDAGLRVAVLSGDDVRGGVPRLAARGVGLILVTAGWTRADAVGWEALADALGREHRVRLVVAGRGGVGGVYPREAGARPRQGARVDLAALDVRRTAALPPPPLGLPSMPVPTGHDLTFELAELGRALFFDRGLSSDGTVSCATCHLPGRAFADGRPTGVGMGGQGTRRNVPSLLNVGYRSTLFWDGASASLELMAKFPMSHADEMNRHYLESADYVRGRPHYRAALQALFPGQPVRFEEVARALAAYQRTLVSGDSPFDRYRYGGDPGALSEPARRGLALFEGRAGCASCHEVGPDSALFLDHGFHNTGAGYAGGFKDLGLGGISDGSRSGHFSTPSLRGVALTAPYMHDGSLATLEDVVAFYDGGGHANPWRDARLAPLGLTARERADLVEFLRALTGSERYSGTGVRLDDRRRPVAGWHGGLFAVVPAGAAVSSGERVALARRVEEAALAGARVVVISQPRQGEGNALDEAYLGALARDLTVWLAAPGEELEVAGGRRYLRETVSLFDDTGRLRVRLLGGVVGPGGRVAPSRDVEWARQLRAVETPWGPLGVVPGTELTRGLPRLAELGARTALVVGTPAPRGELALAARHGLRAVVADPARPAVLDASGTPLEATVLAGGARLAFLPAPASSLAVPVPLGLPPPRHPAGRAPTRDSIALGKALFFDPALSGDGKVSCATCHVPGLAFSDGRPVGVGVAGREGHHNVPSVLNSAYRVFFTWQGRVESLEAHVRHALRSWPEMDSSQDAVQRYLSAAPVYQPLLRTAGTRDVDFETAARALADFQRTLLSGDSPFDRYWFGGDARALDPAARRGLGVFTGKGRCTTCHPIAEDHALFADDGFHNTGIGWHERFTYLGYLGDGMEGNPATQNRFRGEYHTPSLRNVALTAPYMHDGSLPTLEAVVEFYDRGGTPNPNLDPDMRPLGLTPGERADLVAFLKSLTSTGLTQEAQAKKDSP